MSIPYEEKKKLIEAARVLKKHCSNRPEETTCDEYDCIFYNSEDHTCKLWVNFPNDWDIPKPSRWTQEDVVLAKALKGFGITHIFGGCKEAPTYVLVCDGEISEDCGKMNFGAFKDLGEFEKISIDTIIKEAEE